MSDQRRPLVAANWKMNLLRRDAESFGRSLATELGSLRAEVAVFPALTLVDSFRRAAAGAPVICGGQDLHPEAAGAYTGDISGPQLVDAGCTWVLCGHSERRRDHGEDDTLVARKAKAAREHGLTPLVCLGETREERRAGHAFEVLGRQLAEVLESEARIELAYEPVWAIGTGDTATPEIAQEAHAFLRSELRRHLGETPAAAMRVLYGGSANPENAADLIAQEDIDGFLVGGASLDVAKFLDIIRVCG